MTDYKKLQRLLDVRKHAEQRCAVDLAQARDAVREAEETLDRMREQRADLEADLARAGGDSVGRMKTLRLLIDQVDNGIHNAMSVRALAAATEAERLQELEKAAQDRELVEKIVQPRKDRARAAERQTEQKAIDELNMQRYRTGDG